MGKSTDNTTLRDYLRILAAGKFVIGAVVLVAIGIGLGYSLLREPTYEAGATIRFKQDAKEIGIFAPGVQLPIDVNPSNSAAANSEIVTRPDVVRAVQRAAQTGLTDDELEAAASATVQPNSNLVAIELATGKAGLSARLANEFAAQTRRVVRERSRRAYADAADELRGTLRRGQLSPQTEGPYRQVIARLGLLSEASDPVEIIRPAAVPGSPASPKPVRDTMLAAILGLILGIAAAFLRRALDRRLTDRHEVAHELGLPLVGYVNTETLGLAHRNGDNPVPQDELEAFRILRTNMSFLAPGTDISSLVVTSAVAEEGKSTVTTWFAYVTAASGRNALVVDCDLRRPVISDRFGVDPKPGLADYLAGQASPHEVLRTIDVQGPQGTQQLTIIPAGGPVFQPAETITSPRFQEFVKEVTRAYDIVIFDSAPMLTVSDTLGLIPQVDAILLCVRLDQTTLTQAHAAKQALDHLPSKPTGLVVSGVRRGDDDDYYGYYGAQESLMGAQASAR